MLTAALAASYLGIGQRTFENHWHRRTVPPPVRIGRRLLWDRRALDAYADLLSGFKSNDLAALRKANPIFWNNFEMLQAADQGQGDRDD